MNINWHRFWTLTHKWMALVLGLQVLLWIAGGVVMSWFEIERVRGEHNISPAQVPPLVADEDLLPPARILAASDYAAASVTLRRLQGRLVYDVAAAGEDAPHFLYDAKSGQRLSPLPAETALAIALADFAGRADPDPPELLSAHNLEYRAELPVWRVVLNDDEETRLYISPQTGRVVARRNAVWRLYDFFWMLHIMDYEDRTDFNHPLLISFSVAAFLFVVTGILLIFYRFRRSDFAWLRPGRRQNQHKRPM